MEYVTVEDVDVPAPGFGTWPMEGETCRTAVRTALEHGYRHIDTAQIYENEGAVGEAIAESEVSRSPSPEYLFWHLFWKWYATDYDE